MMAINHQINSKHRGLVLQAIQIKILVKTQNYIYRKIKYSSLKVMKDKDSIIKIKLIGKSIIN